MGIAANVGFDTFPKQGGTLNKRVRVCFHFNPIESIGGTCIRDDSEAPFETIFQLDDGRVVRSTECMYQPVGED
jgi:hypothetical protein